MIKPAIRAILSRLAGWIVRFPRLKQVVLRLVGLAPPALEQRLRSVVAPGPGGGSGQPAIAPVLRSAWEKKLLRDLGNRLARRRHRHDSGSEKPRLAFFSPLPPDKSGISHYSLMLLPHLARHYRIDVIVDREPTGDDRAVSGVNVRSSRWFRQHAGEFDRILYHIGNSHFHTCMMEALERWPGAVVLHDFFLGHLVRHMDYQKPGYLAESLYRGHGLTGLSGRGDSLHDEDTVWEFPLNAGVLQNSLGVIVHSPFSRTLAQHFYGDECGRDWRVIPHLREPAPAADRTAVRDQLGIPREAFLVCSFGHITPTKLHEEILTAWRASALASDENCWLVFVGELAEGSHGRRISGLIRKLHNPRVRVTGWAESATFEQYLCAADAAVQLRTRSRGETSGAVIDCLNHGLATVVNAHGTMNDLPDGSVYRLADRFENNELVAALEKVRGDDDFRSNLSAGARQAIRRYHDPATCGNLYRDAIEAFYARDAAWQSLLDKAIEAGKIQEPDSEILEALPPDLLSERTTPLPERQLMVDVSAIVHTDLKTGIERVVRAQLLELIRHPPRGYRVEPVYLHRTGDGWHYHYARAYGWYLLAVPAPPPAEEKVDVSSGDILYMPDLNANSVVRAQEDGLFEGLRNRGVTIHALIHDLLPVTHPEFFPPGAGDMHGRWLACISGIAHQIICISRSVADQYRHWLAQSGATSPPRIAVNHHGADIDASKPSTGRPRSAKKVLGRMELAPTFLMVGTIEPRKGHDDALDAFDRLWQSDLDINLVIVGREGWKNLPNGDRRNIPALVNRLDWHSRRNKNLFWLSDISDDFLEQIYAHSDCLIAASYDEGFGLPLIEAARHDLAVIARDIPVFREVAGSGAAYFDSESGGLEAAVRGWLEGGRQTAGTGDLSTRTWADNVEDLKTLLLPDPAGKEQGAGCGI